MEIPDNVKIKFIPLKLYWDFSPRGIKLDELDYIARTHLLGFL